MNLQHPFAQKWSLRYLLSYISVTRGDFDSKHRCLQPASFPNRPRTGRKQDRSFLSFARGQHPSSRSSAPSYLNLPKSPFQTYQVSFRFRSLSNSFGTRCQRQIPPNTSTWCLRTFPVSSHPFPWSVSIRHYRCFLIVMISSWPPPILTMVGVRIEVRSSTPYVERKMAPSNKIFDASLTLSLTTVTSRSMAICSGKNVESLWDHLQHPLSAIWLPRWRTSSGTKQCALYVFACPMSGWSGTSVMSAIASSCYVILPRNHRCSGIFFQFYRPPVMLEFQNDDKVLGYLCDSSSRTITPQLPDHPSQIKGIRSANDQMFTYSSWSSRSWLIIRGAQPAVQQQLGLTLSHAFMKPKVSIRISFVMFGDDS